MPVYEYECKECGHKFELQQTIAERNNPQKCPECSAANAKRSLGGFSVAHYKGMHFKSQVEWSTKDSKTYYPKSGPKSSK